MFRSIASKIKDGWQHAGFQKYFKNISWMLGGRVVTMTISFVATLYIARNLGPTNFGELSYALSVVGLLGFIAPLGLDSILYRELIRHPEHRHKLLGTTFFLKLMAGGIIAILTVILALTVSTDDVSRILIIILAGTFVFNAFHIVNYEFLARAQSQYQAIISIIASLILNTLKIIIITFGEGIIYLALVLLFEAILYAILYLGTYYVKTGERIRQWRWDSALAVSLLKDSMPLMFISGFIIVYARIDQVFIKHMLGAEEVGMYDAAVRLVDIWNFIPGAIAAGLFPAVVNAEKTSSKLSRERFKKMTPLFILIPLVVTVPIAACAPLIVNILYGTAFADTASVLEIYIWSFIGTSLAIHVQAYLMLKNERMLLILSALAPMIVNICLNLIWIPQFGIVGAAYATVISYLMVPLFIVFERKSPKST